MSGQGMSNDEFRKLMMIPRHGAQQPSSGTAKDPNQKKSKKSFRPKPKPTGDEEKKEDDGPSYRDRAAERRLGMPIGSESGFGSGCDEPIDNLSHLTVEETKFLGGDIEHTHLVKGLDYALLNKVRAEQQQEEQKKDKLAMPPPAPRTAAAAIKKQQPIAAATVPAPNVKSTAPSARNGVTFKTSVGRAVYDVLLGAKTHANTQPSELFLPKRTAFLYELEDPFAPDVPTTLRRAKEDCPKPKQTMFAAVDAGVHDRLVKIMAYMSMSSGGKKKIKKQEKAELLRSLTSAAAAEDQSKHAATGEDELAAAPNLIKPVDDDEDIFADAGTEFVIERRKPTDGGEKKAYFEGPSQLEAVEGPVGPTIQIAAQAAAQGYPEADDDMAVEATEADLAKEAKKHKAKRTLDQVEDDGYAECYPSYYDDAGTIYDSDDNDDKPKSLVAQEAEKDAAAAAKTAKREAMKAQQKEKAKVYSELQEIEKIFEEKGYDKAGFGGKKGGKSKEGGDNDGLPVPQKKRRI